MEPCIICEDSPCCCIIACCIIRSFFCFSTVPTRSCRQALLRLEAACIDRN